MEPRVQPIAKRTLMQRAITRIVQILINGDIEYAELHGAAFQFVIGLCFMASHLQMEVHPAILGAGMIIIGLIQLRGILGRSYRTRRLGSMCSVMVWAFAAAIAGDSGHEWSIIVCPAFVSFTLAAAWGFVRMGRREDFRARNIAQRTTH